MKKCTQCNTTKPLAKFTKHKAYKDGLHSWCSDCFKDYYQQHKEKLKAQGKARNLRVKFQTIEHYGGRCNCCGENILAFLTIDHIAGSGCKHRKEIGTQAGKSFYYWLRRNKFPDGYQVLCFNCNCGRSVNNGICPHKEGGLNNGTSVFISGIG